MLFLKKYAPSAELSIEKLVKIIGNSSLKKNEHEKAIEKYNQILKLNPDNLEIVSRLGYVYLTQDKFDSE